jgi:hypothetical protein
MVSAGKKKNDDFSLKLNLKKEGMQELALNCYNLLPWLTFVNSTG